MKEFAGPIRRRIRELMIIDRDVKDSLSMRIIPHAPDDAFACIWRATPRRVKAGVRVSSVVRIVRQKLALG